MMILPSESSTEGLRGIFWEISLIDLGTDRFFHNKYNAS